MNEQEAGRFAFETFRQIFGITGVNVGSSHGGPQRLEWDALHKDTRAQWVEYAKRVRATTGAQFI